MKSVFIILPSDNDLIHHGILGQKWGVRRYQNKDGSYTKAGAKRYANSNSNNHQKKSLSVGQKRAIKIGAAAVSTALSAYGTYKLVQSEKLDGLISSGKDAVNKFLKRNASQTVDTISDAKTADFLRKMDPSNFKSEKFDIPRVKLSDRAKMHSEAIRNMEKISKVASPTGKQNLAKRIEYSKAAIEEEKNIALKKARENLTDRERNALRGIDSWQRLLKNTKDPAKREIIQKRIRFLLRSSQEK